MRPVLVDHMNRPIDFAALKRERQGPTVSGVRSVITGHPADGLDPRRLAGILRGAEQGSPQPYLELAEQMEERYLHYLSVLGTRKRAVSQLEITVDAFSDAAADVEIADFVRTWLKRDELESESFDILDAIGKGFSATRINWDTSEGQWVPKSLEWWDPRWIEFDRIDGRTPLLRDDMGGEPTPFSPYEFIWHEHKAKSGLPIRGGLARPATWAYLFQSFGLKDWVAFAEVYGLPLRVGRYDNGETEDNIRLLMRAVAGVSSDAAAVIPKSMELEFIDGKQGNSGADLFERLCDYLDRQISKAVLGQTATTDADTGGLGSGKEHGDVRDDIRDADAKLLAATLSRDLIRPMVDFNFGSQAARGHGYPSLRIGRAETIDIAKMSSALAALVPLGLRVSASAVRDKMGFEDPGDDEDVLAPPAAAPPLDQSDPQGGPKPANDPTSPPGRSLAPQGLLKPLKEASDPGTRSAAAVSARARSDSDAIDLLVAEELSGWSDLVGPVISPIETMLTQCASIEEARDLLIAQLGAMDIEAVGQLLARAGFAARLAGMAGLNIQDGGR